MEELNGTREMLQIVKMEEDLFGRSGLLVVESGC
jgi:hypothetical protein